VKDQENDERDQPEEDGELYSSGVDESEFITRF
jgi:hypothetical protein